MVLLQEELHNSNCPYMTAYKLVTVHFRWWGLQGRVENFIHKVINFSFYLLAKDLWFLNSRFVAIFHLLTLSASYLCVCTVELYKSKRSTT